MASMVVISIYLHKSVYCLEAVTYLFWYYAIALMTVCSEILVMPDEMGFSQVDEKDPGSGSGSGMEWDEESNKLQPIYNV